MFGRLAPGVTIEQAQAEFAAVAQRTAVAHPESGTPLRPVVRPYTASIIERSDGAVGDARRAGWLGALTVVVAINLAILVYARTVTRLGEIAVRSALGASRAAHSRAAVHRSARARDRSARAPGWVSRATRSM